MYFSILEALKEKDLSHRISVKEALFELSKIYVITDGTGRSVAEISDKSQKIADAFGLRINESLRKVEISAENPA